MNLAKWTCGVLVGIVVVVVVGGDRLSAQDWPQWRGPNRDGKAAGFKVPETWPKELTKKWNVKVGDGVASPALVGDKLYVFTRQDKDEVVRCLNATTGDEVWKDKYEAQGATGPAQRFAGPRSSPIVADGKVVTLGVRGMLSCYDATSGSKFWQKEASKGSLPSFFISCSPMVLDGKCILQFGGEKDGGIIALDLANGEEKWKWTGDGSAYASPVLLTSGGDKVIVAETAKKIVGINAADGKLLWETAFPVQGGRNYNAATPVVKDQTVVYAGGGRGANAVSLEKKAEALDGKELWKNTDNSVQYNTPVIKDNLLFALSDKDNLFCINLDSGKTAWSSSVPKGNGYGSVVDAGSVLLALNPSGQLIVFNPSDKEFKEIAKYKVADGDTYAYPIASGNRVFVKDKDSVTLWTIE